MSEAIRLSSITVNCPDARALAGFYADITGGEVTFSHPSWATVMTPGGGSTSRRSKAKNGPNGRARQERLYCIWTSSWTTLSPRNSAWAIA